ncbi:cation:proton antiporter [Rhodothermus marinus]|uniref:Sodium/hydrogen exchanger n=1 Tax=Rhodothermus marinus (strain ATCC 43812 / DSM 4252 / R-10) TaxID=518766 RepID=D0MI83_RHOM4|nr:cation:proton antiporter [Rhodothermus marinus]ACY48191.1 sodium/hydrogen exchanger [Rhodothermus marinus DSM 4252]
MLLAAGLQLPFLGELVTLLGAGTAIAYLCYRLRLEPVVGFLLAGVLVGPGGIGLVQNETLIGRMAEIGVILLLFSIGVEFSLEKLARLSRLVLGGGLLQMGATTALVALLLHLLGTTWPVAIFTGTLVALSSTALVMGLLAERGETGSAAGQASLAILIFQDLAAVGLVLLVPLMGGAGGSAADVLFTLVKALLIIGVVLVLARLLIPRLLDYVARTYRHELFLLTVVTLCFGTAFVTGLFGISLALGAFLAGLVVSESPYAEHTLSEILPLRTVFNAMFFMSVGMLLDVRFVLAHPWLVLGIALFIALLKALVTGGSVLALGYGPRVAAVVGLGLAQIGEFSFVLERLGREVGLQPLGRPDGDALFIASAVLLMLATPLLLPAGHRLGRWLEARWPVRLPAELATDGQEATLEDHLILVGYGRDGQHLAWMLRPLQLPMLVIDLDPHRVLEAREAGLPTLLGDASRRAILEAAGIRRAKALVVLIDDRAAAERLVRLAHYLNPTLRIIARAGLLRDVDTLREAGADLVVPEELETPLRLFSHVLDAYGLSAEEVAAEIQALRAENYQAFRHPEQVKHVLSALTQDQLHTREVTVHASAPAVGRTLSELALRPRYGITVLAAYRDGRLIPSPGGDFRVRPGDRLVLVGPAQAFVACSSLFRTPLSAHHARQLGFSEEETAELEKVEPPAQPSR